MDFFDVVKARYSVRKYQDVDIPKEDLMKMVEAAGMAPSGKNAQNWHFVMIKDNEMKAKMQKAVEEKVAKIAAGLPGEKGEKFLKMARFATFFAKAPVVVAVYAKEYIAEGLEEVLESRMPKADGNRMVEANPGIQSLGAGIENLILSAVSLGYGGCWMTSANYALQELEEIIGFRKEKYQLSALVPIGVPAGDRKSPAKLTPEEIVTFI